MKIYDLHMIHIVYSRQGILWIKLSIYISYVVSLSAPLLFGGLFLNLMFGGGRTLGNFTILPLGTLSLLVAVADTKRLKDSRLVPTAAKAPSLQYGKVT